MINISGVPFFSLNCHFVCRLCEVSEKILSLHVISVNYLTVKDFCLLLSKFVAARDFFFALSKNQGCQDWTKRF